MVSVWDPVWVLASLLCLAGSATTTPVLQQGSCCIHRFSFYIEPPAPARGYIGMPLGDMIRYSEPARYDAESLRLQHGRLRRSAGDPQGLGPTATPQQHLTLNFTAHNRDFRLHLRPDTSVFAEGVVFEGPRGRLHYDTSRAFSGELEGEEGSLVQGVVTADGLFDGSILTAAEQYHVEPAGRYLRGAPFHSVIYRSSDVVSPALPAGGCASQRLHERRRRAAAGSGSGGGGRVRRWWVPTSPPHHRGRGLSMDLGAAMNLGRHSKSHGGPAPEPPEPPDLDYSDVASGGAGLDRSEESFGDLSAHAPARPRARPDPWPPRPPPPSRTVDYAGNADGGGGGTNGAEVREASSLEDFSEPYNTYHLNNKHGRVEEDAVLVITRADNGTGRSLEANSALPENTNKIVLYNHTILIRPKTPGEAGTGETNHIEKAGVEKAPGGGGGGGAVSGPDVVPYSKVLSGYYVPEDDPRHVNKRAIDPKKTTCMLYLQADHLFYQKYGTEEACIEVMTRHVQRVNAIYRTTDFNQDGKPDNISFMIKRIKVHSTEALNDPAYRFPDNYGVEKFLELFSEEDYDAFCLAYMFTYRDFEMGTLGLAWTGDLKNAGGVCEKNGHYRGSLKSLNTGIVTLLNYGKHVPPAVSHVTLAHEIGHNFGSPHDPELCTPGGEDGNFIMFARATSGDKKNNNQFSPCSLNSINPVLNAKARSAKGCFTEPQAAICGNGVVEPGEECDCGWEEDCRDKCCFPQRRYPPPGEPPCRLTPRSHCSPSQGPCCTPECTLRFGDKCRDDNGCRDSSFCDGRGPHCPPSVNKPNKTICNDEFVCFMGECTGSICLAYGLESCQCIPGPTDPPTKACELCCKQPGDNNPCLSSFLWNAAPYDVPDMFSKPGTPCNDYNGYCDVFQKCREVDPSGPLATLRKLLLSEESIASFKKWISDNWYFVVLISVVTIVILVMIAKLLAKRPDPKLMAVTIIHSSTTETVRLPGEGGGGAGGAQATIVHPAAARKLPLKRRVRLDRRRRKDGRNKTAPAPSSGAAAAATAATTSPSAPPLRPAQAAAAAAPAAANSGGGMDPAAVAASLVAAVRAGSSRKKADAGAAPHSPRKPAVSASSGRKGVGPATKLNVKKAAKRAKKEVIDYSAKQAHSPGCGEQDKILGQSPLALTASDDPMGKVQSWLLSSQQHEPERLEPEPLAVATAVPKSKSSPAGLEAAATATAATAAGHRRSLVQPTGRLDADKVRLQVMYKTPFKFRLKFKGSAQSGVTTKLSADRVRKLPPTPGSGPGPGPAPEEHQKARKVVGGIAGPRTAMLVRTRESSNHHRKSRRKDACELLPSPPPPAPVHPAPSSTPPVPAHAHECPPTPPRDADIDSNIHTVPSDLEGLLAEVGRSSSATKTTNAKRA